MLAAALAACLLLGVACGDDDDSSSGSGSGSGSGDACDTLEGFDSTVDEITGAGGDGDAEETVGEVQSALEEFQSDLEDVEDEGDDLPSGVSSALDSAASAPRQLDQRAAERGDGGRGR
jgi:hypothetical protein